MRFIKEVLIVFLLCLFIVSAAGENETKVIKGKKQVEVVSLCEGCMIGDDCIGVGVQKKETIDSPLYYCGPDHKGFPARGIGEVCFADYECISYMCNDGLCSAELKEGSSGILIAVFIGVIIIFGGFIFLLFKLGIGFKKISKEEKKMEKEQKKKPLWQERVKGIRPGAYKYKSKFDVLEKKLKEKLKR